MPQAEAGAFDSVPQPPQAFSPGSKQLTEDRSALHK
jgi:hypothetical protein